MMSVRILAVAAIAAAAPAQVLHEVAKLLPTDGSAGDEFGFSMAFSDGVAAVGARFDDDNGFNSGSVSLLDADPASPTFGQRLVKLLPIDGEGGDNFGHSVALSGGLAAVGAWLDDDNGFHSGSAYLFDAEPASPTFGQQLAKLLPTDGEERGYFGISAALAGGLALVGAYWSDNVGFPGPGSAYLFDADPASPTFGQQLAKLFRHQTIGYDRFGWSVALSGGLAAIGAHEADAVFLFDVDRASPTFGQQLVVFQAAVGSNDARFGFSVALADGVAAVGAPGHDDNGVASGSAYLFDADPASPKFGQQLAKLLPVDGTANDAFGGSIALSGGLVIVGASGDDDNGSGSGSVYLFHADRSSPAFGRQIAKLLPGHGAGGDAFGSRVAFSGGLAVVGAPAVAAGSGSASLFDLNACNSADLAFPPGVLNDDDIDAFVAAFLSADPAADCDGTGTINLDDIECFVAAFLAGCP